MDIRSRLKNREIKAYLKMSRGQKLRCAIELSDFALKLSQSVKKAWKKSLKK